MIGTFDFCQSADVSGNSNTDLFITYSLYSRKRKKFLNDVIYLPILDAFMF